MSCTGCDFSLSNTGLPNCAPIMGVTYGYILTPLKADDGTLNRIATNTPFNNAALEALLYAADPSKRGYPIMDLKQVEDVRAESERQTFDDGSSIKLRDGIRTVTAAAVSVDAYFFKKLTSFGCSNNLGAYVVTIDGQLIGDASVDGFLAPIPIQRNTWDPIFVKATNATVSQVTVRFEWAIRFKDENLGMLSGSDIADDVDLLAANGLLSIFGVASAISTTGFTMKITSDYGSVNGTPVKGFTLASFVLFNVTDNLPVTISTVVDNDGTYVFTFPAQTLGDTLRLSLANTVKGFDDENLENVAILIP
ncbi:MAG TPA: hypothetical protein VFV37_11075 [Luteibaculaceae bacterium]|nr:hypothetical protein [Luteibaculaceae bacterium]